MLLDHDNVLQAVTAQQPFIVGPLADQGGQRLHRTGSRSRRPSVPVLSLIAEQPAGVKAFLESSRP